ncbi:hypothetical protein CF327_g197 [Tilletia walkeri]|uniref:Uncharacterized protein n=1 Tax=Tilletia walkeri TaxID=117179 RepID=A0A8X7N2H5_9BASI|nr:hypothetical protein CF327_g197 [Tilletia walkeri]KAE8263876.1 hypothetical protein A4X09_0g7113 [Tilletia walkeri]
MANARQDVAMTESALKANSETAAWNSTNAATVPCAVQTRSATSPAMAPRTRTTPATAISSASASAARQRNISRTSVASTLSTPTTKIPLATSSTMASRVVALIVIVGRACARMALVLSARMEIDALSTISARGFADLTASASLPPSKVTFMQAKFARMKATAYPIDATTPLRESSGLP